MGSFRNVGMGAVVDGTDQAGSVKLESAPSSSSQPTKSGGQRALKYAAGAVVDRQADRVAPAEVFWHHLCAWR